MKLATFEVKENNQRKELWGFRSVNPETGDECVIYPQDIEDMLPDLCKYSSYFELSKPVFIGEGRKWPSTLTECLELDAEYGYLDILKRMESFVTNYAKEQDGFLVLRAFRPVQEVRFKAPIPRPRLYWGLVQNCPSFFRNDPARTLVSLYSQGHQRPQTTCAGHNGKLIIPGGDEAFPIDFTVELGVVIGKTGRYITAAEAMDYVAGYTVVLDGVVRNIQNAFGDDFGKDWYINATASWVGKKTDTMCPMGPYLTTKDEILNPYDLLSYSKQNGHFRDRGFSGELMIGLEKAIEFYSSFATLYPGDVIHLGAMQVDGMRFDQKTDLGPDNCVEIGIEKVGDLRVQFVWPKGNDWRPEDDPTRQAATDIVRDLEDHKEDVIDLEHFDIHNVRHFWTCFQNTHHAIEHDHYTELQGMPRILNNPASALSVCDCNLSNRATDLWVTTELCAVIKKVCSNVPESEAADYILGYMPMAAISDRSIPNEVVRDFCNPQETNIPELYARWGDGYNLTTASPTVLTPEQLASTASRLTFSSPVESELEISYADYVEGFDKVISHLSKYVTLLPGDVISLGSDSRHIEISEDMLSNPNTGLLEILVNGQLVNKAPINIFGHNK